MQKHFRVLFLLLMAASCKDSPNAQSDSIRNRLHLTDSLMSDVNTYCLVYRSADDSVTFKHKLSLNALGNPVNDSTLFEGASLSKTVFAYLFWKLRNDYPVLKGKIKVPLCSGDSIYLDPLILLRHSISSNSLCLYSDKPDSFRYSEDNYILLQKMVEQITQHNLQQLAEQYVFKPLHMHSSSYVWKDVFYSNYVNGHYQKEKLHRKIRQFSKPLSNGTFYSNTIDLDKFAKTLLNSEILDSIYKNTVPVNGFGQLAWGNGMGIDNSLGHPLFWQWGSNWSYNHIFLLDRKNKSYLIVLSNSISGAKCLRMTCNALYDINLELFNYINWY